MNSFRMFLILFAILALVDPSSSSSPCNSTDREMVSRAFNSVAGFNLSWISIPTNCSVVTSISLPSRNLTGSISWKFLKDLSHLHTIDLSGNTLQGSVPTWLWSNPSLTEVNLSKNKLGGYIGTSRTHASWIKVLNLSQNRFSSNSLNLSGFLNLTFLDLSSNNLRWLPFGLSNLTKLQHLNVARCNISGSLNTISGLHSLKYLDVSKNSFTGRFPNDFPSLTSLSFLNISFNNFSGEVRPEKYKKFGKNAFLKAGTIDFNVSKSASPPVHSILPQIVTPASQKNSTTKRNSPIKSGPKRPSGKKISKALVLGISCAVTVAGLMAMIGISVCFFRKWRLSAKRNRWAISKPGQVQFKLDKSGPFSFETESGISWVADIREPTESPVVMFEKPLLSLTFKDLIAATTYFGKESLLAEGRCGPVYRAVLPGELHVAIKVIESARAAVHGDAVTTFEELSRLKHPNLLPLSGYCIAGKLALIFLSKQVP